MLPADSPCTIVVNGNAENIEEPTCAESPLDSQKRGKIEELLVQAMRTYLQELIRSKARKVSMDYASAEVALDFLAIGLAGLLFKYSQQDKVDVKRLTEQICQLLLEKNE